MEVRSGYRGQVHADLQSMGYVVKGMQFRQEQYTQRLRCMRN